MEKVLLFFLLVLPLAAQEGGLPIFVITDTNQIKELRKRFKGEWRTNLCLVEKVETVSTNWLPLGPPVPIMSADGQTVIALKQVETATIMTNIMNRVSFGGEVHIFPGGKPIPGGYAGTRTIETPVPLPSSPATIPMPLRVVPGR